jgi:4-hydroxybenzoyl-CoA reductase subunit beta
MMRLPEFHYIAARSLAEAASRLAGDPQHTRLVAGGTDLWPNLKRRHQSAKTVVGLRFVRELRGLRGTPGRELRLGAMTTLTEIVRDRTLKEVHPGFVRAVASISTPVLRNMSTIGGNLCLDTRCTYYNQEEEWRRAIGYCLKEVGETCWVAPGSPRCWAISASDSAPLLCALGAKVRLHSTEGDREIPVTSLFKDDGIDYLAKRRDEILTEVLLPAPDGGRSTYWKLRRRGSIDFPVLGVGVALRLAPDNVVEDARIFLGAVSSAPLECRAAQDFLRGKVLTGDVAEEAGTLARGPATPMDNADFTLQWRRQLIALYVEGALRELAGLPERARRPAHGLFALEV